MNCTIGKFALDSIHCGDALALLAQLPDACVDLIVTDPPFAIDFNGKRANYHRKAANVLDGYAEVGRGEYAEFSRRWIAEARRALKPRGSAYIFSGWTNLRDMLQGVEDAGLHVLNHIIWKYQFGVFTKKRFVTSHYHVLLCVKDAKRYTFNKIEHYPEDVWLIKREYWKGRKKTSTKLPLEIVEKCIRYSSNAGDTVLDPFMGSGTTAVACKSLGRRFLGFEIVPEYVAFANERLGRA
jgi:site-specific DNA-methyltransferase (adenine-specific)